MARFLETTLRHENTLVIAALVLVVLMAAAYTLAGIGMEMSAISMTFGDMDEMGDMSEGSMNAMPMPGGWSDLRFLTMFLMWWLMMIAMMLPSAAPAVLLYASVLRSSGLVGSTACPTIIFAGSYLLVWAGFSLAATAAQLGLEASGLVSPTTMILIAEPAGAMVIFAAGIYQFTPLKTLYLTHCRTPAEFIARHHRPGTIGALNLGMLHGAYCLGCCVALMALLFVGGVMNIFWIFGLAMFVALEKLTPFGESISKIAGLALTAWGFWILIGALLSIGSMTG